MASDGKVFVSPGVYTSEKDLSFVAQSVGVTTLGLAGETLQGPAFEPIFISSYGEFQTYFGSLSPEKFTGTQIPKYELSYIAKAYLQQSNQLFVTRVLGYSGYDAGPSWSISTVANVDCETIRTQCADVAATKWSASTCNTGTEWASGTGSTANVESGVFDVYFSGGTSYGDTSYTLTPTTSLPYPIQGVLNESITKTDGSTTTVEAQINSLLNTAASSFYHPASCATGSTPCYLSLSGTATESVFGCPYDGDEVSGNTLVNGSFPEWNGSSFVSTYQNQMSGATSTSVLGGKCNPKPSSFCDDVNDPWLYSFFNIIPNTDSYTGFSLNVGINPTEVVDISTSAATTSYSGVSRYSVTYFTGSTYCNYDDLVVATLRSRGVSTQSSGGPAYQVTGLTDVSMVCTGSTFGNVDVNPFATFGIDVTDKDGDTFRFETSLSQTNKNYLKRVFGVSPFDKDMEKVPIFVEEAYPNMLTYAYKKGYIKGLNCTLLDLPSFRADNNTGTIGFYQEQWQTPVTPYLVSELRGTKVYKLFRFVSIADGNSANNAIKISVVNISFERNGEYELKSRYVMVDVDPEQESDVNRHDAVPCGFEGYETRQYLGQQSPTLYYKTHYNTPGEVIWNPPFAISSTVDNTTISTGDKIRRVYLGISDTAASAYDDDFFQYKGKQPPIAKCDDPDGDSWSCLTPGFHMDKGATCLNTLGELCITTLCKNCGTGTTTENEFSVGAASFQSEPTNPEDPYYTLQSRKFTLAPYGGFDGWDIYRKSRTNGDSYIRGKSGFLNGYCPDSTYPNGSGDGSFKLLGSTPWGESGYFATTDYYAYYFGMRTFRNPEAVNVNVFATPGINYVDNSNLVEETIDMIETERADSLYITTTPDYNLFVPGATIATNIVQPTEAVDNLDLTGIDSNYTATYYPWVQLRDNDNNVQLYLPPTYDVMS